MQKIVGVIV